MWKKIGSELGVTLRSFGCPPYIDPKNQNQKFPVLCFYLSDIMTHNDFASSCLAILSTYLLPSHSPPSGYLEYIYTCRLKSIPMTNSISTRELINNA